MASALQPERIERLALGIAHRPGFPPLGVLARPGWRRRTPGTRRTDRRRRAPAESATNASAWSGARRSCPSSRSADGRSLRPSGSGDVVGAHAGEEIVGVIVLAHMPEAEPPILPFAQRPLGARWVAGALQPGHSQAGHSARSRRSLSGLTLMRSNSGELLFMTVHYARTAVTPARLDNRDNRNGGRAARLGLVRH